MWGFLKCNYSYTKILIVLLFSLSRRSFFSGQGDSPLQACPGSARGWRGKEPAGSVCCAPGCSIPGVCEGSGQQPAAQGLHRPASPTGATK